LDLVSTPLLTPDGFPTSTQTDSDSYFTLDSLPSTPGTALIANPLAAPIAIEERETIKTAEDIFQESRYTLLKWKHDEFRRIWEWYLRKNPDDFVVEKYQCIHLREYTIPWADIGRYRPCFAPRATFIKFYGENDTTMGQFIEKHINDAIAQSLDAKAICTGKGCEQHLSRHAKVYVHNEHTISISVEKMDPFAVELRDGCTDRELGHSDIATFSLCRICGENTPFVYLSHEMLRYSFAKFLEIHAYPTAESIPGAGCTHNFFLHHTRYICWKEMSVRLQSDPVILHEIIYPPFRIRVRPETQLELKNDDFQRLHHRNMLWYSSLIDDLKLISIDAATGDEERDAVLTADINTLILRAEAERQDISKLINQTYRDSAPTDTLALNRVHAYRQDKIVAWQMDFDRLPKPRSVQSGTYRNSNRSSAFDSMRAMWPTRRSELAGAFENPNLPSSSVSEAEEELPSKLRRMTVDSSSASDASETEWKDEPSSKKESQAPISAQKEEEQASSDAVLTSDDQRKSDPDSDSTIGAPREPPAVFEDLNSRSLPSKVSTSDVRCPCVIYI
jgi:1-phosphatidylinositol-3-phosphate 5-kinase